MTPDPIDQWSARLFEAARSESLPEGAEQRLLAAALREVRTAERAPIVLRKGVLFGGLLAGALLAAAFALQLNRQRPTEAISAEPTVPRSSAPKLAPAAPSAPSASALPAPIPAPSSVRSSPTAPRPSASAGATLSDELDALKIASSALSAGDSNAALAALDRYDHVLKGSKLRAEATLLRVQALARAGNTEAASALAQRFVEQNPNSPLVDRARSFIATPGLGGN